MEESAQSEARTGIEIREFYSDFAPPRYVKQLISNLLSSVPTEYLRGLDCVVLTNQSGAPRRHRLGKVTSRKRRVPQSRVQGRYHRAYHGRTAWIELFVDNLVGRIALCPTIPLLKTAIFGQVLFHEIGHHIDATIKPEFREKEDVADSWSKKLGRNYMRQRYGFPKPVRKLMVWLLRITGQEYR